MIFTKRPITVEKFKNHYYNVNDKMYVAHDGISIQEAYEMELEQVEIKNKQYYAELSNKLLEINQAIHNANKDALKQSMLEDKETRKDNISSFPSMGKSSFSNMERNPFERRM